MAMRERRVYRGRTFDVWTRDGAWFWMFGDGGAIGAAAGKEQAVGEVRGVIDQFLGRSSEAVSQVEVQCGTQSRSRPSAPDGHRSGCYRSGWNNALDGLARYLAMA